MRDPSVPASCMKLKMPEMFLLAEPRKGERRTKIQVFFAGIFFCGLVSVPGKLLPGCGLLALLLRGLSPPGLSCALGKTSAVGILLLECLQFTGFSCLCLAFQLSRIWDTCLSRLYGIVLKGISQGMKQIWSLGTVLIFIIHESERIQMSLSVLVTNISISTSISMPAHF